MNHARTCLVSGAGRGIGRAIGEHLLAAGWRVIGLGRHIAEEGPEHPCFTAWPLDLGELALLPDALRQLAREHQEIDAIVCNAGMGRFGALEQFSADQVRELIDLNLTSQILLAREFLPLLKRRGRGDLIFMGSEAALSGGRNGAVYCATKFALRGLAQSLRAECAGSGVRVGIVNPGMVETGFFDELEFRPGDKDDEHLEAGDVAAAVWLMLDARPGAAIDEITLSPQKRVIRFGEP
ncbi:MAG TPA: SDR family oxidoreductase [Sedimenticola thiotaurini]|uniref:SDR family oxidoreductase n=1 Tax=Sedimenticola thiotaurini TaxID=1543721 RepID=A0A831W4Y5_9GAMM|nr:SDR family oxidoreductase [Sedimenticola thiotaurini]